jgi:hypothetical protein
MSVCSVVLAAIKEACAGDAARPIATAMVAAGELAVDDCCGGLLAVAPERVYRSQQFPTEAVGDDMDRGAASLICVDVVVSFWRCVPVITEQGEAPSIEVQEAATADVLADAAAVWRVVTSRALLGDDGSGDPLFQRSSVIQTFTSADGGCVGSETRFVLGLDAYTWCPI